MIKLVTTARRRRSQGMTEYIIIVGLIAIVLIAAVKKLSAALNDGYTQATLGVTAVGQDIQSANEAGKKKTGENASE